jgi:hypothetical protein
MSETSELEAAAATGAAAAVHEVHDQQAHEEATLTAVEAAADAHATAEEATEHAQEAAEAATEAAVGVGQVHQETQALGEATADGLSAVHARLDAVEQRHEAFRSEITDYLRKIEEAATPSEDVQKVEVTNAASENSATTGQAEENPGETGTNGGSESGASRSRGRHRFGGR